MYHNILPQTRIRSKGGFSARCISTSFRAPILPFGEFITSSETFVSAHRKIKDSSSRKASTTGEEVEFHEDKRLTLAQQRTFPTTVRRSRRLKRMHVRQFVGLRLKRGKKKRMGSLQTRLKSKSYSTRRFGMW